MRKTMLALTALMLVVTATSGCGDDDVVVVVETTAGATTQAPTTTAAPATEAPAPTAAEPATETPAESPTETVVEPAGFAIGTNAFGDGGNIPVEYSCDGTNDQPELLFFGTPDGTTSLALTVIDPDGGDWIHWIAWNIPPSAAGLEGNLPAGDLPKGIRQAQNDYIQAFEAGDRFPGGGTLRIDGWDGPCPGPQPHRYVFTLYALTGTIDLPTGTPGLDVLAAIEEARDNGSLIDEASMIGMYPAG